MAEGAELIRRAYDAFARGDMEAVMEAADEDVEWAVTNALPQGGVFSGKAGVGDFFDNLGRVYEDLRLDVQELLDCGDQIVGLGRVHATLRGAGQVEYGFAHVFTIRDGRVARFREYADTDGTLAIR